MNISNMTLVAADIEANGFGPHAGGRIIEIGACKIVNGKIKGTFSELANPGRKIRPLVTTITGITNDMLKDSGSIESVMASFKTFIGDSVIVAHDADQDMEFLEMAFKKQAINFNNDYICTKRAFNKLRKIQDYDCTDSLSSIAAIFGIEQEQAHRAGDDAIVTAKILLKIYEICPDAVEIVDINSPANMKYKQLFDNRMSLAEISAIRGCKLATVEKQFLNWLNLGNMHKYREFIASNLIELPVLSESVSIQIAPKSSLLEPAYIPAESASAQLESDPDPLDENEKKVNIAHTFEGKLTKRVHSLKAGQK